MTPNNMPAMAKTKDSAFIQRLSEYQCAAKPVH
jgi:hypothetical protein